MDYSQLQNSIVSCVIYSHLTQQEKINILYYLFYQLCWDFDIEKYISINYD